MSDDLADVNAAGWLFAVELRVMPGGCPGFHRARIAVGNGTPSQVAGLAALGVRLYQPTTGIPFSGVQVRGLEPVAVVAYALGLDEGPLAIR